MEMMSAADVMNTEHKHVKKITSEAVDVNKTLVIVELDYGVIVETSVTDDESTTLTETLFSIDRKIFTIIGRWRVGGSYHEMRGYPRDSYYPLKSKVRL